jgi:hypothetical protein
LRGLIVAIVCAFAGCSKPPPVGTRGEITFWLDPPGAVPKGDVAVATQRPSMQMEVLDRAELKVAVAGIPADGDASAHLWRVMDETYRAGSNTTVVVTTRCLKDLVPEMQKHLLYYWHMVAAVGARCDGGAPPRIGAAVFVEAGSASRVKVTYDRRTRAFLKVEPLR